MTRCCRYASFGQMMASPPPRAARIGAAEQCDELAPL
jgi:hypothetical protein